MLRATRSDSFFEHFIFFVSSSRFNGALAELKRIENFYLVLLDTLRKNSSTRTDNFIGNFDSFLSVRVARHERIENTKKILNLIFHENTPIRCIYFKM